MADTLEIRIGGKIDGRSITTRDLDYSEINPLVGNLESAAIIDAGLDQTRPGARPRQLRPLNKVRLALAHAYTPTNGKEFGAVYEFAVGPETSDSVSKITAGLAGRTDRPLIPEAAKKVQTGLRRTIWRGLSVQLVNGTKTPVFSVAHPPPVLAVYPTRKYESEIAARVFRVGGKGKRPAARVKLLGSGQEATVELSGEKAARELGHHLYRDAILMGSGEWVIDPKRFSAPTRLLWFKVTNYRLLNPTTTDQVIDEMTDATGGVWDDVDPADADRE